MVKIQMLIYDLQTAHITGKETRHAQDYLKYKGITYIHSVPQSMGDCWWFYLPKNLPKKLPKWLSVKDVNPFEHVGYGLSEEDAEEITKSI